jgi:hypothetical protein
MESLAALLRSGRSGVFWLEGSSLPEEVERRAAEAGLSFFRARGGRKKALLQSLARALRFPEWFGGNWDALEECLKDLSWLDHQGVVLLLEGAGALAPRDLETAMDVLRSAADFWAGEKRPMLVLLRGGRRPPGLGAVSD